MDLIAFSHLTRFHDARRGERSPESDYGFHTWTGHIHVGCTGCITRALHPCGMLRCLQEVHGQLRAAHVQHTGDFHAVQAGSRRCGAGLGLPPWSFTAPPVPVRSAR